MIDVDLDKQFTVCTLSRHDLKQMGLSDAEIEALDDESMQEIAESVGCFLEDD